MTMTTQAVRYGGIEGERFVACPATLVAVEVKYPIKSRKQGRFLIRRITIVYNSAQLHKGIEHC